MSLKSIHKLIKAEALDGYVETSALAGGENVVLAFHEAVRIGLNLAKEDDGPDHVDCLVPQSNSPLQFFEKYCNIL